MSDPKFHTTVYNSQIPRREFDAHVLQSMTSHIRLILDNPTQLTITDHENSIRLHPRNMIDLAKLLLEAHCQFNHPGKEGRVSITMEIKKTDEQQLQEKEEQANRVSILIEQEKQIAFQQIRKYYRRKVNNEKKKAPIFYNAGCFEVDGPDAVYRLCRFDSPTLMIFKRHKNQSVPPSIERHAPFMNPIIIPITMYEYITFYKKWFGGKDPLGHLAEFQTKKKK